MNLKCDFNYSIFLWKLESETIYKKHVDRIINQVFDYVFYRFLYEVVKQMLLHSLSTSMKNLKI